MNAPTHHPAGYYYHYKHDPLGAVNHYAYFIFGAGHHTEEDAPEREKWMQETFRFTRRHTSTDWESS